MAEKTQSRLTLKQAAAYLGIGEFRMRNILKDGLAKGEMVEIPRGKGSYERWEVTKSELDKYAAKRGARKDGKKAYVFRGTPEQVAAIEAFAKEQKFDIEIEPRYKSKAS
jgi:hypothetical protein